MLNAFIFTVSQLIVHSRTSQLLRVMLPLSVKARIPDEKAK
jgi:hypothetical protein